MPNIWRTCSVIGLVILLTGCVHRDPLTTPTLKSAIEMPDAPERKPTIIAHRGASGYLPEHTLEAYQLAIDLGTDYIEPDLVITKDGVLVARHDRYLSTTTNVAEHPEFADRRTVKADHQDADWFVEDFMLAELKTLRAVQPRAGRSKEFDGKFTIPTFDEILQLARKSQTVRGQRIGVYPETKHPRAFEALGLHFDAALLESLNRAGYQSKDDPVFIQSFEADILKRLRSHTSIRFVYLMEMLPAEPLEEIAKFADAIGPYKRLIVTEDGTDTGLVARAHLAGLSVHPWTFRDDDPPPDGVSPSAEMIQFFDLGVDGLFTDFADTGVRARSLWEHRDEMLRR